MIHSVLIIVEDQEQSLWESHPFFWKYFYWLVILYVIFTIVLFLTITTGYLWLISIIAYIVLAIPTILQFIKWKRTYYKITEKRIIIRIGILSVHEKSVMVDKVENFEVVRGLIDRLFNTGDIIFHTEGESDPEGSLKDVPKIRSVEQIVTELLSNR